MRLIDAEKLPLEPKEANQFIPYEYASGWNDMLLNVLKAEQIDAVPVVRCRECKLRRKSKQFPNNHYCLKSGLIVYPDGFCSYAEPVNPCKTCQLETPNCDVCKKRKEGADHA